MDKSSLVLCLHIWPPFLYTAASFTQTLIFLHTSVRLHRYGKDEAALGLKEEKKSSAAQPIR